MATNDLNRDFPWLTSDAALRRFLRKNPLTERHEAIRRLIRGGLPTAVHVPPEPPAGSVAVPLVLTAGSAAPEVTADLPKGPPFDEGSLLLPEPFVGRKEDYDWVVERLRMGGRSGSTALAGMAGIGKTALAARAVRQLRAEGRFVDGVAVVICQDKKDPIDVLRLVLARFDSLRRLPRTTDPLALEQLAHRVLEGKDTLIVLDNVEPDLVLNEVVRRLRVAGVTLLLTARHILPQTVIPPEASRMLEPLGTQEALDLLAQTYREERVTHPEALEYSAGKRIVTTLKGHTLAIKLTGAYARDLHRDLFQLADELAASPMNLPDAAATEVVQVTLRRSIEALSPESKTLFAALAAFATEECGRQAAIALGEKLDIEQPGECLNQMVLRAVVDASLKDTDGPGDWQRLQVHPLLWAMSLQEFETWSEGRRTLAKDAVSRYFARYVSTADEQALDADPLNIAGAIEWAHERGQDEQVADLCAGMQSYWSVRWMTAPGLHYLPWGYEAAIREAARNPVTSNQERVVDLGIAHAQVQRRSGRVSTAQDLLDATLESAERLGDRGRQATVLSQLGQIARARGELPKAEQYLNSSLAIRRDMRDQRGEGLDQSQLGQIAQIRGELDRAEALLTTSLMIRRGVRDQQGEAVDLSHLGQIAWMRGQMKDAERLLQESQTIAVVVGDRQCEGMNLGYLGRIARATGHLDEAAGHFEDSLRIARDVNDRRGEGATLSQMARMTQARGDLERAGEYFQESLKIRREMLDRRGEGWDLGYLGRIARERGQLDEAESRFREALAITREVHDRPYEAEVLHEFGQLARVRGTVQEAKEHFERSLAIRSEVQDQRGRGLDLNYLGRIAQEERRFDDADTLFRESLEIARALGDRRLEAMALSCLGQLAIARNLLDEATKYLLQSLEIRVQLQDVRGQGVDKSQLGRVELLRNDLERAQSLYEQALEFAGKVQNRQGEATDWYQLARIAELRGNFVRAEEFYRSSLRIARQHGIRPESAHASLALGSLLIQHRQDAEQGCTYIQEAIRRYAEMGSPGEAEARELARSLGCED